jgi:hypothetical protein
MGTQVLLPVAVNSKSERQVDSLPPLGLESMTFGKLTSLVAWPIQMFSFVFIFKVSTL